MYITIGKFSEASQFFLFYAWLQTMVTNKIIHKIIHKAFKTCTNTLNKTHKTIFNFLLFISFIGSLIQAGLALLKIT